MDRRLRVVARSSRCGLEVRGNGRRRSGVENAKHTWAVVSGAFVIDDKMLDVFQEGGWRDFKDELPISSDYYMAVVGKDDVRVIGYSALFYMLVFEAL